MAERSTGHGILPRGCLSTRRRRARLRRACRGGRGGGGADGRRAARRSSGARRTTEGRPRRGPGRRGCALLERGLTKGGWGWGGADQGALSPWGAVLAKECGKCVCPGRGGLAASLPTGPKSARRAAGYVHGPVPARALRARQHAPLSRPQRVARRRAVACPTAFFFSRYGGQMLEEPLARARWKAR